jgi:pimeloyl-ACP methyl ester carboxylesterase
VPPGGAAESGASAPRQAERMSHAGDQPAFRLPSSCRRFVMIWRPGEALRIEAGASLEARCWGPPPDEAPTLVLLHEGLGSAGLWRDLPAGLAQATGWGVLAWSRAGYGASDPCPLPRPLDYMEREATEVLPRVLDAVRFRRGVLVGHSDGATIAALYAGTVGDFRVRGLVLMAPHFFVEDVSLRSIAAARQAYESGDLRTRLAPHHADPDAAFRGWSDAWLHPGFRNWNITPALDYIRVPVLAIQGADDDYGTPAQLEALEAVPAPVEAHLLPGCRHAPHLERPEATLRLIGDFLARLEAIEVAGKVPA